MEATKECISIKPRAKCNVPVELLVLKKRDNFFKKASLFNKRKGKCQHTETQESPERTDQHIPKRTVRTHSRPNR